MNSPDTNASQEATNQTIPGTKQPDGAQVSLEKGAASGTTSSPSPDVAANADAALHNANAQAGQIKADGSTQDPKQVRSALEKGIDDELDNAISFANKALDILCGDSKAVITEEEARASAIVLAHIPDYAGLREEAQLVVGPLVAKKVDQLVVGASESAKRAFALALQNLKGRY